MIIDEKQRIIKTNSGIYGNEKKKSKRKKLMNKLIKSKHDIK